MAQAELGCFLELGWPLPTRIIDLYGEFKIISNGLHSVGGRGLLGAMSWFGIPGISKEEKKSNRDLVLRGGPWTHSEQQEILDYCQSDVDPLPPLLMAMLPSILATPQGLGQALLRGRYTAAVARMERSGYQSTPTRWRPSKTAGNGIKTQLIDEVDSQYGVFDDGHFRDGLFARYLFDQDIPWPRTDTGLLKVDDDTFSDMTKIYPQLQPLKDLRHALGQMRLADLAVGKDSRNRTSLWPFSASTGRNAPSSKKYIFGPSVWLRRLIKPGPGRATAYIDYGSQEIAIAAALSGDHFLAESITTAIPTCTSPYSPGSLPEAPPKPPTKTPERSASKRFSAPNMAWARERWRSAPARKLSRRKRCLISWLVPIRSSLSGERPR